MMKRLLPILAVLAGILSVSGTARAQFKSDAFSQNYGTSDSDTAQKPLFSVKDYIRGIAHKDTILIGTSFAGSVVLIGGQQIYNRQYWKLPIIYGGLGATVGFGLHYRKQYTRSLADYNAALELDPETPYTVDDQAHRMSNWLFAGGALLYWGTMMDGVINFKSDRYPRTRDALFPAVSGTGPGLQPRILEDPGLLGLPDRLLPLLGAQQEQLFEIQEDIP